MIKVKAKPGEGAESLVRRFKRAVQKEGLLNDLREKSRYKKPSEVRREKENRRRLNALKAANPAKFVKQQDESTF